MPKYSHWFCSLFQLLEWDQLMERALLDDQHDFVDLFLDHAVVDIEDFLNVNRMLNLYNHSRKVDLSVVVR